MIKAGVVGATGYAGAELVRLLAGHSGVELSVITSRQYSGQKFSSVYPAMKDVVDLVCEDYSPGLLSEKTDVVFLALPHKVSMSVAPELIEAGLKVVDLSADFRFSTISKYEAHYQEHTETALASEAVYGLCEIFRDKIASARLIGNPGCYPTSILLPLVPLLREGLISPVGIVADSKSGVSGAGRSLSLGALFCEVNEGFKAYKVCEHRHTPEIEENLSLVAGEDVEITFVPHLIPVTRGMLSTIYATVPDGVDAGVLHNFLRKFYDDSFFVRICEDGEFPDISHVAGTNFCNIGIRVDEKRRRVVIVSVIDNLVKGAAGQAVQNMNIIFGLEEKEGLEAVPYPV